MSESGPAGALTRAVAHITVDAIHSERARKRKDREMGADEIDAQFILAVKGTATSIPGFGSVTVPFDHSFFYAPGQRDSDLETPVFTSGAESFSNVMLVAKVEEWLVNDDDGSIVGAVVGIGVIGSGNYSGYVHCNFQGYGALREDDTTLG